MGMNVKPFVEYLNDFLVNEMRSEWKIRQITMTLFLFHRLVDLTPKLTGFARNNWRVSTNYIPKDINGRRFSNKENDTSAVLQTDDEIRDELNRLGSGVRAGGISFVYNNTPYIQYLEYGWSDQRPTGFLEIAVNDTRNHFVARGWLK